MFSAEEKNQLLSLLLLLIFLFKQHSNKKFAPRVTKTHLGGLQLLLTER